MSLRHIIKGDYTITEPWTAPAPQPAPEGSLPSYRGVIVAVVVSAALTILIGVQFRRPSAKPSAMPTGAVSVATPALPLSSRTIRELDLSRGIPEATVTVEAMPGKPPLALAVPTGMGTSTANVVQWWPVSK